MQKLKKGLRLVLKTDKEVHAQVTYIFLESDGVTVKQVRVKFNDIDLQKSGGTEVSAGGGIFKTGTQKTDEQVFNLADFKRHFLEEEET